MKLVPDKTVVVFKKVSKSWNVELDGSPPKEGSLGVFVSFDDWDDGHEYLIEFGRNKERFFSADEFEVVSDKPEYAVL